MRREAILLRHPNPELLMPPIDSTPTSEQDRSFEGAESRHSESHEEHTADGNGATTPRNGRSESWNRWRDDLASVTPQRAAMVGGAAALGVMVGAAATRMIREMR